MEKGKINKECNKIIKQICDDLDEDLNSPFCYEIKIHLQKCPLCCAFVESIRNTVFFCQKLIDEDVPPIIDKRLWKILNLKKPGSKF